MKKIVLGITLALLVSATFAQNACPSGVERFNATSFTVDNDTWSLVAFHFNGADNDGCGIWNSSTVIWHFEEGSFLDIYDDGSALLHGMATTAGSACPDLNGEIWEVHIELAPIDYLEPKEVIGTPDFDLWKFFYIDGWSYIKSSKTAEVVTIERREETGAQMGQGANGKTDTMGFSTWFVFTRADGYTNYGDVNINIEPVECEDCNECDGKVTNLTLMYNGSEVNPLIEVIQKKDEQLAFSGVVPSGDTFYFEGLDKHGTLGTEIIIRVNGTENARLHTSCSQPIGPGVTAGDFEVTSGASRNGGALCPAENDEPGDPSSECCDGKVNYLELRYSGDDGAFVEVYQKKDMVLVFSGGVDDGDEFSISGMDKKGTLSTEVIFYLDGDINARMHTSCSVPIGPGLVAGNFEVVAGTSRNGGDLCPVDDPNYTMAIGNISAFPNPFKKDFKIELKGASNISFQYSIVNKYGKVIVENSNAKTNEEGIAKIKGGDLSNGLHYLIIDINGTRKTQIIERK